MSLTRISACIRATNAVSVPRNGLTCARARTFATSEPAKLPDLPYDYGALAPVISAQIMELHHKKHHQAYVNNFNNAMQQQSEAEKKNDIGELINLQAAIRFNGGGHINHSIFWTNLAPQQKYVEPSGDLLAAINKQWGSLQNFQSTLSTQTVGIQGSGWGWLALNKTTGALQIITMPNQDPVTGALVPLLGIDVWEHAYYLDYKNVRADYVKNIWTIVNWANVAERYGSAVRQVKK